MKFTIGFLIFFQNITVSFQNKTVLNLIKVLNNYGICNGISVLAAAVKFIEHSVPKVIIYHCQRLSTNHYFNLSFTDIRLVLVFCQLVRSVSTVTKMKERKLKL